MIVKFGVSHIPDFRLQAVNDYLIASPIYQWVYQDQMTHGSKYNENSINRHTTPFERAFVRPICV